MAAEDKKVEETTEDSVVEDTDGEETPEVAESAEESESSKEETVGDDSSESTEESEPSDDESEESDESEEEKPSGPPKLTSQGKRLDWYAVYVYSGHERKVKGNVERMIEVNEAEHLFGNIEVPLEDVVIQRAGKNTRTSRPSFPGYVLFQMVARDLSLERHNDRDFIAAMEIVGDTPGVRGFVGGKRDPAPLSDEEVRNILSSDEPTIESAQEAPFSKGDKVVIAEGPFANFDGVVDEVLLDRHKVKVLVTVFGRSTPIEAEYHQVRKVKK